MKHFSRMYSLLEQAKKEDDKKQIIEKYLLTAREEDKLWALHLLLGRKTKKLFSIKQIFEWSTERSGLPQWLLEDSNKYTGDIAETISMVLSKNKVYPNKSLCYWMKYIESLHQLCPEEGASKFFETLEKLNTDERFVFIKIITGGLRFNIKVNLLSEVISQITESEETTVIYRLESNWLPGSTAFKELFHINKNHSDISKPYQFCKAGSIINIPEDSVKSSDWAAEWKWDGIRAQLIFRNGELFIWSKNNELLTAKFPEFDKLKKILPEGIVLDGEILCYINDKPMPVNTLKSRMSKKSLSNKVIAEVPVVFMIYDILENDYHDIRSKSFTDRRKLITEMKNKITCRDLIKISSLIEFKSWKKLNNIRRNSRKNLCEGIILKNKNSDYYNNDSENKWLKWLAEPYSISAVMMYAGKADGDRSDLYAEYSFAVWDNGSLTTISKVSHGLDENEVIELSEYIKNNTLEKFGPVRTVKPELVFEITFDGILKSSRHKSGVILRSPKISKWLKNKKPEDAGTLMQLKNFLYEE